MSFLGVCLLRSTFLSTSVMFLLHIAFYSAFGHSNAHGVTVAVPMPATNCSDSIVAGTAHYLEQHDPDTNAPTYETLHKAGGPHRFTLMNETAAEERFFHARYDRHTFAPERFP